MGACDFPQVVSIPGHSGVCRREGWRGVVRCRLNMFIPRVTGVTGVPVGSYTPLLFHSSQPSSNRPLRSFHILCTILVAAIGTQINASECGPVTNLLIPRYVSLKANEANARRGPSLSHRIDWIFKKKGMPLEIYGEYDNWRRVRDAEGAECLALG